MTLRRTALLLALLAAPLGAQGARKASTAAAPAPEIPGRRPFDHKHHIRTELHAPTNFTMVELEPLSLRLRPDVRLRVMFRFPGRELKAPPASLTFAVVSRSPLPLFTDKPSVSLARDQAAAEKIAVQHWAKPSGHDVDETVYATMPRAQFLRLAAAYRAELKIDTMTFALEGATMEALRDLASRMSPAGFRQALAEQGRVDDDTSAAKVATSALSAGEVDTPVRPIGLLSRPRFPAGAPAERHRVHFRYVVDTTGRVETGSLRGESPTADAPYLESLREAAAKWVFRAALKGGKPVRMEVRQVYEFEPPK